MRAVIFDIDGTLLHSSKLDDETYISAIHDVLGPVQFRKSWSHYKNVSGSGTLLEILGDNNIGNTADVLRAVEEAFVARISSHIEKHGPIMEVPGAKDFVSKLASSSDCQIAYATAGWLASAQIKLRSSHFPVDGIPLASCNDHIDKATIMTHACKQLTAPFDSITYYGDGKWDELAANMLGWHFVPVGKKLNGLRHFS
ncbi:HAD family hydrolase [Oculatella sp. LEGE 06141]|uniref:HAD family hydrolase n=1 Tax=Oculatella sp. LEGE 06141 TaxID=1828648 RepID=UPI001880D2AA|nr:HAD family hydrolase [Oculatella sp. LEGE 06141]MBE9182270.1 HAD family hydrolase [Oculatella sp. LEGE 06141]